MVYTREQIEAIEVGHTNVALSIEGDGQFGRATRVVQITARREDIHGKLYVCGYRDHGEKNTRISFSVKEGSEVDARHTLIVQPFRAFNPDAFQFGGTEVWYARAEAGRDLRMGSDWLNGPHSETPMPSGSKIHETHIMLGTVPLTERAAIYLTMQGENWSPCGEANDLIERAGLHHTSMSIGDVIKLADGTWHMVDRIGFVEIAR